MGDEGQPRAPGWYPEPYDGPHPSGGWRFWDGRAWSQDRRSYDYGARPPDTSGWFDDPRDPGKGKLRRAENGRWTEDVTTQRARDEKAAGVVEQSGVESFLRRSPGPSGGDNRWFNFGGPLPFALAIFLMLALAFLLFRMFGGSAPEVAGTPTVGASAEASAEVSPPGCIGFCREGDPAAGTCASAAFDGHVVGASYGGQSVPGTHVDEVTANLLGDCSVVIDVYWVGEGSSPDGERTFCAAVIGRFEATVDAQWTFHADQDFSSGSIEGGSTCQSAIAAGKGNVGAYLGTGGNMAGRDGAVTLAGLVLDPLVDSETGTSVTIEFTPRPSAG